MGVLRRIVGFYEKYENLNMKVAFFLISLQVIHLYWLTTDVAMPRAFGGEWFAFPQVPEMLFVVIDYLELPALFSGITFYLLLIRKRENLKKNASLLLMLALQVLHIFWITDEFVVQSLLQADGVALPVYLAWVAIMIDYLEIPVMVDLFRKFFSGRK